MSDLPTDDEIRNLFVVEAMATQGKWVWWMSERPPFTIGAEPNSHVGVSLAHTIADAELIATSRNIILPVCQELIRLRAENASLRAENESFRAAAEIGHKTDLVADRIMDELRQEVAALRARLAAKDAAPHVPLTDDVRGHYLR